jgi:hypothetical protein
MLCCFAGLMGSSYGMQEAMDKLVRQKEIAAQAFNSVVHVHEGSVNAALFAALNADLQTACSDNKEQTSDCLELIALMQKVCEAQKRETTQFVREARGDACKIFNSSFIEQNGQLNYRDPLVDNVIEAKPFEAQRIRGF